MIFGWHYLSLGWYIWFLTDTADFWLAHLIFGWYVSDCWLTHLTFVWLAHLIFCWHLQILAINLCGWQPLIFFTVTLNFWWALLTFSRNLWLTLFSFSWHLQTFANTLVFGCHLWLFADTFSYWLTPSSTDWHLLIVMDTASCSYVRIVLIMLSQWQLLSLSDVLVNFSYPIFT